MEQLKQLITNTCVKLHHKHWMRDARKQKCFFKKICSYFYFNQSFKFSNNQLNN